MFSPTYSWAVLLSHNPHSFILSSICKSPGRELTGGGDMLCREVTGSCIVAYIASSECLFNNTLISIYILSAGCHDILPQLQCSPVHLLSLFVLALAIQHRHQVIHA